MSSAFEKLKAKYAIEGIEGKLEDVTVTVSKFPGSSNVVLLPKSKNDSNAGSSSNIVGNTIEVKKLLQQAKMRTNPGLKEILTLQDMLAKFIYCSRGEKVISKNSLTSTPVVHTIKEFHAAYITSCYKITQSGNQEPKTVYIADLWKASHEKLNVVSMTWLPGSPEFIKDANGEEIYNTWKPVAPPPATFAPSLEALELFHQLGNHLYEDRWEDYQDDLAHIEQYPGELIPRIWVHIAYVHGHGRGTMTLLSSKLWPGAVGDEGDLAKAVTSNFNHKMAKKLQLTFSESKAGKHARMVNEILKQISTEPTKQINEKYGIPYIEKNCCRYQINSNNANAIYVEPADRRYEVVNIGSKPRLAPEVYVRFRELLGDASDAKTTDAVYTIRQYLQERDLVARKYQPGKIAAYTSAKEELIKISQSDVESELDYFLDNCMHEHEYLPSNILRMLLTTEGAGAPRTAEIKVAMAQRGWVRDTIPRTKIHGVDEIAVYRKPQSLVASRLLIEDLRKLCPKPRLVL